MTIGIPAFFLALAPSDGPWRPVRFLRELASFAIPAGTAMGLGVVASFLLAINLLDMSELRARTVATTVLVVIGLYLIVVLESSSRVRGYTVGAPLRRPARRSTSWCCPCRAGATSSRSPSPDPRVIICSIAGTALAVGGLALTDQRFLPGPSPPEPPATPSGSAPA